MGFFYEHYLGNITFLMPTLLAEAKGLNKTEREITPIAASDMEQRSPESQLENLKHKQFNFPFTSH
jgi:hypothetical protein